MKTSSVRLHLPAQLDRNVGIGGTDARMIAAGDWLTLYREKVGEVPRPNLDYVWKARLGLLTENLHAWWHGHVEGARVLDPFGDHPITHDGLPSHHYCTLDKLVELSAGDGAQLEVLEMKHTNERNNLRDAATFYMGQLQWQLHVTGEPRLRFSIIRGNSEPEWGYVERDDAYVEQLLAQVEAFWWHVTEKVPPEDLAGEQGKVELAKAAGAVTINGFKPYRYETNNEWVDAAADFVRDKIAAEGLKDSEKKIRGLIPRDAEIVTGGGVSFKRDARGAYRCTIDEAEAEAWRARFAALRPGGEQS